MNSILFNLSILFLICFISCNTKPTDEENIISTSLMISESFKSANNSETIKYYAEDAVSIEPHEEFIQGKEHILKYWNSFSSTNSVRKLLMHRTEHLKIKVVGNTAYDYGYWYSQWEKNGEILPVTSGKFLNVWEKDPEGNWKIAIDSWNLRSDGWDLNTNFQDLTWSPDGKGIYFSAMKIKEDYSDYTEEKWGIYKYDFATKTTSKIIDSALYVAVSPSGKQIAVGKRTNGNRDIFLYDSEGKNPEQITSHPADDYAASFSPDGKRLVFNSKRDGKTDIYVINTDKTGLEKLTNIETDGAYDNPQWSPSGNQIVFYHGTNTGRDQIFVMNADGSGQKNITNDTLLNYFPGWVDQNKIIYTQNNKNGSEIIFTMYSDGTSRKPLLQIRSFFARISPNGESIAYVNEKEQCITVIANNGEVIGKITLP